MHVLVSGGTGFIGSALLPALSADDHCVTVLTRQALPDTDRVRYIQSLTQLADTQVDAVINLAGASMAGQRWTSRYKRELVDSRLNTTDTLIAFMRERDEAPDVFLSASAVGYYGHHGDQFLSEEAHSHSGFASDLCRSLEQRAADAEALGVRTCFMRFGVVLDGDGGALRDMERPFRLGIANWMGNGRQWLSWVHRADAVAAICLLLNQPCLAGAFNITAPTPVTSRQFCAAMQEHFRTFGRLPMPAPMLSLMLGGMADELLLSGQRVVPSALLEAGFEFRYPELAGALEAIYGH